VWWLQDEVRASDLEGQVSVRGEVGLPVGRLHQGPGRLQVVWAHGQVGQSQCGGTGHSGQARQVVECEVGGQSRQEVACVHAGEVRAEVGFDSAQRRIGGVTGVGVSRAEIMARGDWFSNAVVVYMRAPIKGKVVGKALMARLLR
jgi:hypothetical protein